MKYIPACNEHFPVEGNLQTIHHGRKWTSVYGRLARAWHVKIVHVLMSSIL